MMSSEKLVLLTRPHPFIVAHMKEFINRIGYVPKPIQALNELKRFSPANVKGAVISTAVDTEIEESYEQVFQEVRSVFPKLPVLFATLADVAQMAKALSNSLSISVPGIKVVTVREIGPLMADLGTPNVIPLFHLDDIKTFERAAKVDLLIRSHFK
ncbi:MAG: hypothetical protein LLH30_18955 [Candidatus Manganitrophus sp. SA1]|nr:hypothetical protein [Candidatus Manganitrophus morganii]